MQLKKTDVYNFLENKEDEVIVKKVTPHREVYENLKQKHLDAFTKKMGLDDPEFNLALNKIIETLTNTRDELDYNTYRIGDALRGLLDIRDNKSKSIGNGIDYNSIIEVREARMKYEAIQKELQEEFRKIKSAVKSLNTGKQGYTMLKNLGFDVSGLTPSKKTELLVLNVNSNLIGLPENKDVVRV